MPLNLPASSATERRQAASSWRKEEKRQSNETPLTQQFEPGVFGRSVTNIGGSPLTGAAELLVEMMLMISRSDRVLPVY